MATVNVSEYNSAPNHGSFNPVPTEWGFSNYRLLGVVPDVQPPTVDNFAPANGSAIEATDPIAFDVKDNNASIAGLFIYVDPGNGKPEAVYDLAANQFLGTYGNLSAAVSIAGGLAFTVRRFEGWVGNVTVTISVVDSSGNINT